MPKLTKIDKDLYYFKFTLVDDKIDIDNERFTEQALYKMSEMYIGKIGFIGVNGQAYTARIFDSWVNKKNGVSEVEALAYMYLNDAIVEEVSDFLLGHDKFSLSCSCNSKRCSICGKNQFKESCEHVKGKEYGNHIKCFYELSDISDVYEWAAVVEPEEDKV